MHKLPVLLHIDNSTSVTGAYKALFSWCLIANQYKHIWILPKGSAVIEQIKAHFEVYEIPFVEVGRNLKKLLVYIPALWINGEKLNKIISRLQPAAIHVNDLYNLTPYISCWQSALRPPIIVHVRMLKSSFPTIIYNFWKNWHLRNADKIIAVSSAVKKDWNDDYRVKVIYDPIHIAEKLPAYQFDKKGAVPFKFVYLANYISGKGQDDAIKAIKYLVDWGTANFIVDFWGGTMGLEKNQAYKQSLVDYAAEHNLTEFVRFNEQVADTERLLKQYHAVLHFSAAESFGMVCFEALYYGLPVISSDCGGPSEMINPDVSGILVPNRDINALAQAMKRFIDNPEMCQSLSKQAVLYTRKKFSNSVDEMAAIFKEMLS